MIGIYKKWQIPALGAALALPLAAMALADDETPNAPPAQPSGQSVELNPQNQPDRQDQEQDRIDAADRQVQPAQQEGREIQQQQRTQFPQQQDQAEGKQTTLEGKLVWFEQYMMQRGDTASSAHPGAPSGVDMLVLKTDQGLVMLSHDTMRHLRAASHARLAPAEREPGQQEEVVGIERREQQEQASTPIAERQGQQQQQQGQQAGEASDLTIQSDDPDAQFRIVQGDQAQVEAGDWELREGSATRISRGSRGDESYQSFGIERRSGVNATGKQASVTGKLYEKDGIRFLKVESINLQDQPSE